MKAMKKKEYRIMKMVNNLIQEEKIKEVTQRPMLKVMIMMLLLKNMNHMKIVM